MRPLEQEFNKHGQTYVLLVRTKTAAIFEVRSHAGGVLGWEVIRIKVAPAVYMKLTKTHLPEREVYPSTEDFGTRGWFYSKSPVNQWDLAQTRYKSLQTLPPQQLD